MTTTQLSNAMLTIEAKSHYARATINEGPRKGEVFSIGITENRSVSIRQPIYLAQVIHKLPGQEPDRKETIKYGYLKDVLEAASDLLEEMIDDDEIPAMLVASIKTAQRLDSLPAKLAEEARAASLDLDGSRSINPH